MRKALLALAIAFATSGAAAFVSQAPAPVRDPPAPPRILTVRNLTDQMLFRLYVESVTARCWCEDVLGEEVIEPKASLRINLGDEKSCRYDLVAEMKDGTRISQFNADLCAGHVWTVGPAAQARLD